MIGIELPCRTGAEVARVVRALGSHRYVAGRGVHLHAALVDAVADGLAPEATATLESALAWARDVLASPDVDAGSRDPRLLRAATEREVAATLEALWSVDGAAARARLEAFLVRHDLLPRDLGARTPFDEANDEDHPLFVDAGWELLSLRELDPEKHRGAIEAYDEPIFFEAARFEEASAVPPVPTLHELSAIGPVEALAAIDGAGALVQPIVLYTQGDETYLDYVLRGVLRAAKLA